MSIDWVRQHLLTYPHATEGVQWGNDLVFKIGGKMFAVLALEPSKQCMSFKCSPEEFAELTERPGIVPAPYMARASWVALETDRALPMNELKRLLKNSYDLVFAGLTKRAQQELTGKAPAAKKAAKKKA